MNILNNILNVKQKFKDSLIFRIYSHTEYVEIKQIEKLAEKSKGKKLLDAGAGSCKYKSYFKDTKYTSQDACDKDSNTNYTKVDISSEIYNIPVEDNSFDFILCTQVLEHLKYPVKALKEFNRILKKGGELWLSVPLCGGEHQIPYDYFRPTRYWLKDFGEETNFKIKELHYLGNRFITLATILKTTIPGLTENPQKHLIISLIQLPIIFPIMTLLYFLDKFDKDTTYPTGFFVIYKKK